MRSTLPFLNNGIKLEKESHIYTNEKMEEYSSVSSIIASVKKPFDRDFWSYNVARSRLGWKTAKVAQIKIEQKNVLLEWDEKKDKASIHGTLVHDGLEQFVRHGHHDDEKIVKCGTEIVDRWLRPYKRIHCEVILHHEETKSAGTTDLLPERPPIEKEIIVDVGDYKTNIEKGIYYDNIKEISRNEFKYYNTYFLDPLSYLEYCNYIEYSIQMSMYAYFLESQYGLKVGKLFIIFIDKDFKPTYIPCAYMKYEVMAILEPRVIKQNLKPLPDAEDEYANW